MFLYMVGICFICGMEEEVKLILVVKRVLDGVGIRELRDYSNW